jgi:hypothetical protein
MFSAKSSTPSPSRYDRDVPISDAAQRISVPAADPGSNAILSEAKDLNEMFTLSVVFGS